MKCISLKIKTYNKNLPKNTAGNASRALLKLKLEGVQLISSQ